MAVNRPQVAVLVGPLVPNRHAMVLEVLDVGISGNEPEQFVDNRFQVHLLGRQQRETFGKVKPHLVSEDTLRADAGPVVLDRPFVHDALQQVQVLFHRTEKAKMMAS